MSDPWLKKTFEEIKDMKKERKEQQETYDEEKKDDQNAIKLLNQAKEALLAFHKKHKLNAALTEFIQGEASLDYQVPLGSRTFGLGVLGWCSLSDVIRELSIGILSLYNR